MFMTRGGASGAYAKSATAAWSLGGLLETPPRWHATIYMSALQGEFMNLAKGYLQYLRFAQSMYQQDFPPSVVLT